MLAGEVHAITSHLLFSALAAGGVGGEGAVMWEMASLCKGGGGLQEPAPTSP